MSDPILSVEKTLKEVYRVAAPAVDRITRLLERWNAGSDNIIRSPFMDSFSPDEILSKFDREFNSWDNSSPLVQCLRDVEEQQRSKFGPMSIAKPWVELRDKLKKGFHHPRLEVEMDEDPSFQLGHVQVGGTRRLRPITVPVVLDKHTKKNASAGLPFMKDKREVLDDVLRDFEELVRMEYPCVPFKRTQEQGKTRLTWGRDVASVTLEQCFFQPFLNVERSWPWRAALNGPDAVNRAVTTMFGSRSEDEKLVSIDFSGFDISVNPILSYQAFRIIESYFQANSHVSGFDLGFIADGFVSVPLITPDGIWKGSHGVPSGSAFTNSIDSLVQLIIAKGVCQNVSIQIQGDDGAYLSSDPEALFDRFRGFGLVVNTEKSVVATDHLHYLQNVFTPAYRRGGIIGGVYPLYRALTRLCFMESWTDLGEGVIAGSDYFSLRAISILENCKYHPYFRQFVEWVRSQDREHLNYSPNAVDSYVAMRVAEGKGEVANQYSDDVKGIARFDTIKILKGM